MRIQSTVGLAVGPIDATHWGQVLVLPGAYGVVEVYDPMGKAQEIGVQVLSQLGKELSRTITSLSMLEDIAMGVRAAPVVSIVLLVPVGRVVYLVLCGRGAVYVKRGGELASLIHQEGGLSGEVREGDIFLLVSHGFSQILTHQELTKLFDHLAPSDVAEKLTLLLHEKQGGEGSVALVYGATQLHEESKYVPTPAPPARPNVFRRIVSRVRPESVKRYIASLRHQPKKATAVVSIFLILLFLFCVTLGVIKQTTAKKNQEVAAAISDARRAFDEGVALLPLNPIKGRERLTLAKQVLDPYIQIVSSRTTEGYQLSLLYREITDNLTEAMHVIETELPVFYDMSLIKKGATATSIALDGNVLAVGDGATGTVYSIDIVSKKASTIAGGEAFSGLSYVTIHGNVYYTFTKEGIIEVRGSDKKTATVIKPDSEWGTIGATVSFGGNVYLLDTMKGRIWKYVATETGFSEIREYLNPDTLPNLSEALTMAIDGSVWLGTTNGKVLRFTQGRENTFIPKGIEPALGTKLLVYTDSDMANVYILDGQNGRVVICDKDGGYLSQYHWSGSNTISNFVVSEEQKKILLASGGTIYAIDLK
jgi:hypothetical protein